jgi:DNA (cytosine-5)-methyltransferase 1
LTFVSAFAGIGGFDLALERVGMRCVGQIEIDPACRSVLARHFPEVPRHDDIRTAIDWWATQPRPLVDVLTGGFPCQDLSTANTTGRVGLAGQRSGLFFDLARAIGALRPRWVLLENVTGLLHANRGRDFATVLDTLGQLGYGVAWQVLDAQRFGLAQQRRRVFLAGRRGAPCPVEVLSAAEPGPPGAAPRRPPQDPSAAPRAAPGAAADRPEQSGALNGQVAGPLYVVQAGGWSPLYWRNHGPSYTLNTADRHIVAYIPPGHDQLVIRGFTPRECERLQGFPDDWTATGTDGRPIPDGIRYRMLGNAVAVPVVEWVGHRLLTVATGADRRQAGP